ncbi:MAG: mucoidy inhibitor MuiA family protein [Pseudohongiellaceae bacterium]
MTATRPSATAGIARRHKFLFPAILQLLALINPAQAQDIELELPVDRVTVHPRSAVVTRSGQVQIPAGGSTLVITNLPANLDPGRLQLTIDDSAVSFSNLELREAHQGDVTNEREDLLQEQLQSLQDTRGEITDRIDTAQSELDLLASLTDNGGSSGVRPTINGPELEELITVVSQNASAARERIRLARIELRDIDRRIAQVEFELSQVATRERVTSQVRLNLQTETPTSTAIALSYPRENASWSWLYEGRLDTGNQELNLVRQAAVAQGTGEDWTDVALTLTTADAYRNTRTPEMTPLFVDIFQPRPLSGESRRVPAGARTLTLQSDQIEEVVVTGSFIEQSTQYLVEFEITGRVNVTADRQQHIVPLDRKPFNVDLIARTVPALDENAYIEARFTFDETTPIQDGRIQLYRDGAFIGDSYLSLWLPGEDVRLPFGVDDRIEVERFPEEQQSRSGGFFSDGVQEDRVRIEVTSRHAASVPVEVIDRVPVSRNNEIDVEIPGDATAATETDVDGEAGVLMWRFTLAPQETEVIRHYVRIEYPSDEELFFER